LREKEGEGPLRAKWDRWTGIPEAMTGGPGLVGEEGAMGGRKRGRERKEGRERGVVEGEVAFAFRISS